MGTDPTRTEGGAELPKVSKKRGRGALGGADRGAERAAQMDRDANETAPNNESRDKAEHAT
jgi:hypothetical protein